LLSGGRIYGGTFGRDEERNIPGYQQKAYSVVLSPRVITLGAAKEPDLAFISRTELAEPPDCKVVRALGALNLDSGHSLCLSVLFDNDDLILTALDSALHLIGVIDLPDITTFPAFQLTPRRY
jgi:hypothetical protein